VRSEGASSKRKVQRCDDPTIGGIKFQPPCYFDKQEIRHQNKKTREKHRGGTETAGMATLGLSKVFILDKYFTELQKFWETEKKLQGESVITRLLYLKRFSSFIIFKLIPILSENNFQHYFENNF